MPIVILVIGIVLIAAGLNDKLGELKSLLKESFNPDTKDGFPVWAVSILIVGAIGYSKTFRPVSHAFLALVLVSIVLANKGFFDNFVSAIKGK